MKVEVGKTYEAKNGKSVEIVGVVSNTSDAPEAVKAWRYIGFYKDRETGEVLYILYYNLNGEELAAKHWDLMPRVTTYTRVVAWWRHNTFPKQVTSQIYASEEAFERDRVAREVNHALLKVDVSRVEVEE